MDCHLHCRKPKRWEASVYEQRALSVTQRQKREHKKGQRKYKQHGRNSRTLPVNPGMELGKLKLKKN